MKRIVLTILTIGSFSFGFGQVGVETDTPTETLDVNGEARIENLPQDGDENAIYTLPSGGRSSAKDQTFNATGTVIANDQGVLGVQDGLPFMQKTECYKSTTTNFSELGNSWNNLVTGVATVDMGDFSFEFRPTEGSATNNFLFVKNNTATIYDGGSGGDFGRGQANYFTLPNNQWRRLSDNIDWNLESSGVLQFWTDLSSSNVQNFYSVEIFAQRRIGGLINTTNPSVCVSVTRLK